MKVSEINHFKCVQAAKAVHGCDSITDPTQTTSCNCILSGAESVVNIQKRFCAIYGSCAVDRSTVGRLVQRVKASGRGEVDESVIRAVRTSLRKQETSWYREGMHALVSRWCKTVDVDGDYVEK